MTGFAKLQSNNIKIGMKFSAPVFFEDGKNMFLAEGKAVKRYHLDALKRWSIPYLLTYGKRLDANAVPETQDDLVEDLEEVEELS